MKQSNFYSQFSSTVAYTLGFLSVVAGLLFLFQVRSTLLLVFVALILAAALTPAVNGLYKKWRVPKKVAAFLFPFFALILFGLSIAWTTPPLIKQTTQLIEITGSYLNIPHFDFNPETFFSADLLNLLQSENGISRFSTQFEQLFFGVLSLTNTVFTTLILLLSLLFLTYYIVISPETLARLFSWILPGTQKEKDAWAEKMMQAIIKELGHWVRGRLVVMLIIGIITYFGLTVLGIPYALPLAVAAMLLEIIPNIGPILSAIPAVLVAFLFVSPFMAVFIVVFYTVLQQIESFVITPQVMNKSSEIHPLVTVILILLGYELMGAMGSLLSLPIYVSCRAVYNELAWYKSEMSEH